MPFKHAENTSPSCQVRIMRHKQGQSHAKTHKQEYSERELKKKNGGARAGCACVKAGLEPGPLLHTLFFISSFDLSNRSDTQVKARSMPSTLAVAPTPSQKRDAIEKVRMFDIDPITTNPSIAEDSCASCGYVMLPCAIFSKFELLRRSARGQIETSLLFSVQTFVDFAPSLCGHSL